MKILIISEFFPEGNELNFSGGVEARNYFVAKNLAKRHHVTIITSSLKGVKSKENINGINIIRTGKSRSYQATAGSLILRLKFAKEAIKCADNLKFDVVEGTNFITHYIARKIATQHRKPVIAWYPDVWVGSWIENAGLVGIVGEILERTNLRFKYNAYIAISKSTANKLKNYVRSSKIEIIPCGVQQSEWSLSKKQKFPTILTITRLAKYKNIKTLIFAFAKLTKEIKNVHLVIIGRGPEEKNLKDLARNLKVANKVIFRSNLKRRELTAAVSSADLFCLPSNVEGFGIAVIEAAAAGLPYVVSDIDVFREITKNGLGGYLVEPGDVQAIYSNLAKLLTDHGAYRKKSQEAKKLSTQYDWLKITRQTEEVYMRIVANFKG